VDEVLAVGDAEFQKKAVGKMQDVSKGEGRTVLFVSHNMGAIEQLCNKALILANGTVSYPVNNTHLIVDAYLKKYDSNKYMSSKKNESGKMFLYTSYTRGNDSEKSVFQMDENVIFNMEFLYKDINDKNVEIGIALNDKYDRRILISFQKITFDKDEGKISLSMKLPANLILPGSYYFQMSIYTPYRLFEFFSRLSPFEISLVGTKYINLNYDIGVINYDCEWIKD
jgi:lipopolysaccharide transport system ATP-binding protein